MGKLEKSQAWDKANAISYNLYPEQNQVFHTVFAANKRELQSNNVLLKGAIYAYFTGIKKSPSPFPKHPASALEDGYIPITAWRTEISREINA